LIDDEIVNFDLLINLIYFNVICDIVFVAFLIILKIRRLI
jgi:hypothetical protein